MIQGTDQATAQAIAQLTAYAPTLLADNTARYPLVVIMTVVGAIVFTLVTWKCTLYSIRNFKTYETEGLGLTFGIVALIVGAAALIYWGNFFDVLTYWNHPDIWALKDLVSSVHN